MKKISDFEMGIYRRVLRISWKNHVTNEEVLRRIGKQQEVTFMVKKGNWNTLAIWWDTTNVAFSSLSFRARWTVEEETFGCKI